jgi:hypothetical protein
MKTITRQQAVDLILAQKAEGTFFGVEFVKRTTGELRKMVCLGGVTKHLVGGSLAYDPKAKNLIGVWDSTVADRKKAYRMIAVEGIKTVNASGEQYEVVGE